MSIPLSSIGAVAEAAKLAQGLSQSVARGVSGALGFHDVLSETSPADASQATAELTEKIRQRLTELGVEVNEDLPIRITESGTLQMDARHPRAAEIESVLNADDQIAQMVNRMTPAQRVNGLTIEAAQGNIQGSPGGYPNW